MSNGNGERPDDREEPAGPGPEHPTPGAQQPERLGIFGNSFSSSRKTLTTIVVGVALVVVLARLGVFSEWGNQPPVRYILSDPERIDYQGSEVDRYWLHVPVGTEDSVIQELLTKYIVPEIIKSSSVSVSDRESTGDTNVVFGPYLFRVFSSFKPNTEELKTPLVDEPDSTYLWSQSGGLSRQ